jgi:predicted TIM-barrel enzyme
MRRSGRHRPDRDLQFRSLPHGRARLAGRAAAYGDANQIVVEMAAEVLPVVKHTPVLAGVCGTDPFRNMDVFLDELKRIGFCRRAEFPDRRA